MAFVILLTDANANPNIHLRTRDFSGSFILIHFFLVYSSFSEVFFSSVEYSSQHHEDLHLPTVGFGSPQHFVSPSFIAVIKYTCAMFPRVNEYV